MQTSSNNKKLSLADKCTIGGLWALPYDAIPHIFPSVYRPLSLYFLVLAFFFYLYEFKGNIKLNNGMKNILVFFFATIFIGSIVTFIRFDDLRGLSFYIPSICMGVIGYISFSFFFNKLASSQTQENYIYSVFKIIGTAYIPAIFLGSLEALSSYHVLPYAIKISINSIFGGWTEQRRVCLVMSEASYAATHMAFVLPIYWYLYRITNKKVWKALLYSTVLLLAATMSTKGFGMLFLMLLSAVLLKAIKQKNLLKLLQNLLIVFFGICIIGISGYFLLTNLSTDVYYVKRILAFQGLSYAIQNDGSAFTRIGLPLIALRIWQDFPIWGGGTGAYNILGIDYLREYMPFAMSLREYTMYLKKGYIFAACISTRVLSDFGLWGGIIFFLGIKHNIQRYLVLKSCIQPLFLFISIPIVFLFLTGNFAYMLFWVSLAFVNQIPKEG